jgi:hypothetical protein
MRSFLREMQEKFLEIESICDCGQSECPECNPEGIEEQNVTGALDGGAGPPKTPFAFSKKGADDDTVEVLGMKRVKGVKESVNTPPSFKWKTTDHQQPESAEEVFNDKFPFATDEKHWWQNDNNEYPTRFFKDGKGTNSIKDTTTRIGNLPDTSTPIKKTSNYMQVHEVMDRKYEQLIESYRAFATGDSKMTPEQKVKNTIKEVAKKLQEIETLVNHTSRLKTESGLSRTNIGSSADKALIKISERLTKIAERVRSLGE